MIAEGATAPGFELPAVVDGELDRVALEDYLGQQVVILAFYPGDFNPACSDGATDLDELDLFTMQKDVSILALSADSVYSHQAFADEYELHIPLLSDPRGEVAADYGVTVDDPTEGHLVNRAVVVIGLDGTVEFAWMTENLTELAPVEQVRESVDSVGGDRTAEARYGVGHAHYVEGRRQFTSAMKAFEDEEWMMARGDFERAEAEFSEAADEFNTAVRFGEDEENVTYFERAEDKAEALWQAAEWLAESANAYASGEGATGQSMRQDAEGPLEAARDIHEPVPPADFPPEEDPADHEEEAEEVSILPDDEEDIDTTLDVDIDDAAGPDEAVDLADEGAGEPSDAAAGAADGAAAEAGADAAATAGGDAAGDVDTAADEAEGEDDIDEAELEEITAELEQQTEQAAAAESAANEAEESAGSAEEPAADAGSAGIDWDAEPGPAAGDDAGDPPGVATQETRLEPSESDDGAHDEGSASSAEGADDGDGGGAADAADVDGELDEVDLELELTDPSEGEDQLVEPAEREVDEDGEATVDLDGEEESGTGGGEPAAGDEDSAGEDEAGDEDSPGEDEAGDEELGSGDHGVPDSL